MCLAGFYDGGILERGASYNTTTYFLLHPAIMSSVVYMCGVCGASAFLFCLNSVCIHEIYTHTVQFSSRNTIF